MDILKVGSDWIKRFISLPFSAFIKKTYGYDVNVKINDIEFTNSRGKVKIHVDVEMEMDESELKRIMKAK